MAQAEHALIFIFSEEWENKSFIRVRMLYCLKIITREMSETVKVMVRCRPMNKKEMDRGCVSVVDVDYKNNLVSLKKEDSR